MFSTCSELTPRAPIRDGRMEQIMQPWYSNICQGITNTIAEIESSQICETSLYKSIRDISAIYASRSDQVFWVLDNEHALPITAGAVALITPSSHHALDICPLHLPFIWCLHSNALRCQSVQLWKQLIACFCKTQFHRMYQLLETHNFQFEV